MQRDQRLIQNLRCVPAQQARKVIDAGVQPVGQALLRKRGQGQQQRKNQRPDHRSSISGPPAISGSTVPMASASLPA